MVRICSTKLGPWWTLFGEIDIVAWHLLTGFTLTVGNFKAWGSRLGLGEGDTASMLAAVLRNLKVSTSFDAIVCWSLLQANGKLELEAGQDTVTSSLLSRAGGAALAWCHKCKCSSWLSSSVTVIPLGARVRLRVRLVGLRVRLVYRR